MHEQEQRNKTYDNADGTDVPLMLMIADADDR